MVRHSSRRATRGPRSRSATQASAGGAAFEPLELRRLLSATISGTLFNDPNGDGVRGPSESALPGRTVYLDTNGNGTLDAGTTTVPSTNVPAPILDNATITNNLTVSGVTGLVTDVNVNINISHTYDSDLTVDLISPAGQRVRLFSNNGGSGENFVNTVLDDEAPTAIGAGAAPFTGSFRPIGLLSTFDGSSANGTWHLDVADTVALDSGTLNSWSIQFTTGEPAATTDANGAYSFTVAPGSYSVRQVLPGGWVGTTPAGGNYAVSAVDGQTYSGRDFGSGLASAPPVATLVSAPDVTAFGGAYYYYSVRYGDAVYVDYQSIVNGHDTQVSGPNGYVQQGNLANLTESNGQWTATYYVTAPGGTWDGADQGAYTIALRDNEVSDLQGNFTPGGPLGAFNVSDPPPTATLISSPDVSAFGGAYYYYTVRYADNVYVDYQSIVNGHDTTVTGPNGYSQQGNLANLTESGGVWTATYYVTAPGGTWDAADQGAYSISLNPNEVKDLAGNFTPAQTLGGFNVSDPPPTATLTAAPDVTAFGGIYYYYTVRYADNVYVDYTSIVNGHDTEVSGPNGFLQQGNLANLTESGGVWTATYYITAPGGTWDAADAGAYTIALRANEVKDLAGNFTPAGTLGTFNVSDPPPTATLTSAPNVTTPGAVYYYYTVRYADNVYVDYTSIVNGNDTVVTGPGAFSQLGSLANLTESGGVWTATYYITAPGGTWDSADAGTYTISLRANEVKDLAGNFSPAQTLGTFQAFPTATVAGVASPFSNIPIVPGNGLDLASRQTVLT